MNANKRRLSKLIGRIDQGGFGGGFALVELLAVIAIIGLLVVMLVPVIRSVRKQVEIAQCASNLRQLYLAYRMYAAENNDRIVWARRYNDKRAGDGYPDDYGQHWPAVIIKYSYLGEPDIPNAFDPSITSNLWHLRKYYTVLGCPTHTNALLSDAPSYDSYSQRTIPGGPSGFMNYGANEELTNLNDAENRGGVFFGSLAEPSKTILIGDTTKNSDIFVGPTRYFPGGMHDGAANILFADGHVALMPLESIPDDSDPKIYNLWWRGRYIN